MIPGRSASGNEGPRQSAMDQAADASQNPGTHSSVSDLANEAALASTNRSGADEHQPETLSQPGSSTSTSTRTRKATRVKWTSEELKYVMKAYYLALEKPLQNMTKDNNIALNWTPN